MSWQIPVLADTNHQISRDYGVLKEDEVEKSTVEWLQ